MTAKDKGPDGYMAYWVGVPQDGSFHTEDEGVDQWLADVNAPPDDDWQIKPIKILSHQDWVALREFFDRWLWIMEQLYAESYSLPHRDVKHFIDEIKPILTAIEGE